MTHSSPSVNRDFKGIWIPRDIWLAGDLSALEKCLWAEIDSLYDESRGGCYAENDYLANFLGVKERRLQEMVANLKAKGWLTQVSFDGRTRVLKAIMPDISERAGQRCRKVHPGGAEKCTSDQHFSAPLPYSRDITIDITTETPPMPPLPDAAKSHAASAAEVEVPASSKKPKKQKAFDDAVIQLAGKMLAIIAKHNPVYRPPTDLTGFYQAVHSMLLDDQQDPVIMLKVFEWACADLEQRGDFKGWHSIICTNKQGRKPTNPAEIFRSRFSTLYAQMRSKPVRKFAPCSDDDAALAKWNKAMESAL